MEGLEKIYEKLKDSDNDIIRDILKDIVIIDGAIAQSGNEKYKQKVCSDIEKRYSEYLEKLKYNITISEAQDTLDSLEASDKKDINTRLGFLKIFLVRICAIKNINDKSVIKIVSDLENEDKFEEIKEIYIKLDKKILELM